MPSTDNTLKRDGSDLIASITVLRNNGNGATGLTVTGTFYRESDGQWWNTGTNDFDLGAEPGTGASFTERQNGLYEYTLTNGSSNNQQNYRIHFDVSGSINSDFEIAQTIDPDSNVKAVSDDSTAADNLESDYDGTGYAKANSTIGTCTVNTDTAATLGTPANIDSGGATIADNLKKIVDDSGGSSFDATTDSLEAIRNKVDTVGTQGLSSLSTGTAQAGAAGTITLAAGEDSNNDFYNNTRIIITGGTGIGQSRYITDYDGSSKVATITPNWVTNPDNTSTYEIQAAEADTMAISYSPTAADNVESVFTGTGVTDDVDLSMRSLTVTNDSGDAVSFDGSNNGLVVVGSVGGAYIYGAGESNAYGLLVAGDGSGKGVEFTAQDAATAFDINQTGTGKGLSVAGGTTSGNAIDVSTTSGNGLNVSAAGGIGASLSGQTKGLYLSGTSSYALEAEGSNDAVKFHSSGDGRAFELIASANNSAIHVEGGGNQPGLYVEGGSAGNSDGVQIVGAGSGEGLKITAGATGNAVELIGGATSGKGILISTTDGEGLDIDANGAVHAVEVNAANGDAVRLNAGTNGDGLQAIGAGTGSGFYLLSGSGATGDGLRVQSQATNGNGLSATGTGTANGLKLDSSTSGKGIEINQRTASTTEDIFELMYSKLVGKFTMGNTGGSSEIEEKFYDYAESSVVKTQTVLKPDLSDNTDTLATGALAGREE